LSPRAEAFDALFREVARRAALPQKTQGMRVRSGGFYHDDDPIQP